VCCDEQQLRTLERQLAASVLVFNRCPSCVENFRGLYCYITCSPDQAHFMNATNTYPNSTGGLGVTDEDIYISETYATEIHTSCKDVVFPQTNGNLFIKAERGDINPTKFSRSIQTLLPTLPGKAIGLVSPAEMGPLDEFAYLCQDSPSPTEYACSCTDCEAACPAPPPVKPDPIPFTIGAADGVGVIMLIIFLAMVVGFTAYLLISCACQNKPIHQINYAVAEAESKISYKKAEDNGGRTLVSEIPFFQKVGKRTQDWIGGAFRWWGTFVARRPLVVLVPTVLVCVALIVGVKFVILTTDPIELWSSPTSRVRQEKDYYDSKFGAFYRTEMIILRLKPQFEVGGTQYTSFTVNFNMPTLSSPSQDICFKPLSPDNNNCTITSVMNYWQNDPNNLFKTTNYTDDIKCCPYPVNLNELIKQQPSNTQHSLTMGTLYSIITFVVNNFDKSDSRTKLVKAWEKQFLKFMGEWESEHFDFAYFSERSPEDELERSSQTDLLVFAMGYLVIFIYIAVALGTYTSVDSKLTLGVSGILVILASVFTSIGFFGYIGYATSLIVIEVVPFLVLAIGADNVFILTLEYQVDERRKDEDLPEQIGRVMGEVGPSMLLCSLTECVAFFLGALTDMPAVQQFALAAAVSIAFDFLLQITAFLAVLSIDARRTEMSPSESKSKSYLENFFEKYYAPFLMNDIVRYLVVSQIMVGFAGLSCWCAVLCTRITVGLDQDLSVPKDSYVLTYFDYMEKYLDVGVPVYFVTKGPYNFANENSSSMICGGSGCDTYSLTQQISYASQNPDYWKIETPSASWYDDYVDWLPPQGVRGSKSCCRYEAADNDKFCPATNTESLCQPCLEEDNYTPEQFMEFLPWFLIDNPGINCNKGGHSAYGNAVNIVHNYSGNTGQDVIEASYFMSYHSVSNITKTLKLANTDENGNIIGNEDDFTVFPYCLYYVYYEQYLTLVGDALFQLGICLIPTFVFSFVLLGFDWYSGIITVVTIIMIVVDTAGLCSLWGVDMNAVALINLVAAIGLSVEFISHVVRSFSLKTNRTRKLRVIEALSTMGPAVFAGVALTNLPGIIVLNWATAQLIQIFFFRMCLVITLLGTAHGLIFLPVFLSYFG
uniref:SSD domain-containing protein n=1 Tax=Ciona savignyi TaxID=51511 RepID=H2Z2C6_CIOSA